MKGPKSHKPSSYDIVLKQYTIVKSKQYPIPQKRREADKEELARWKAWGIIERSNSPHNNTLHVIDKKDLISEF